MTPDSLAEVHERCFTTPRPWKAAEFEALLASPHVSLLGDRRAFLLLRTVLDESEILTLATDPDHQRKGYASALLRSLHQQESGRIFLEVAADNLAAQALYENAGYTCEGVRRGYYRQPDGQRVDALLMARPARN